jgi:hypothetical protein
MILHGLRRRVGMLEQRIGGDPVTLHMPDGSVRCIPATNRNYFRLFGLLDTDPENVELGLIRSSVEISGRGAEAFHLLRSLLIGPIEEGEDE